MNQQKNNIAFFLKESSQIKVTDDFVDLFTELVNEKHYFPINELVNYRDNNEIPFINNRIEYILRDNNCVIIERNTNMILNNYINENNINVSEVIENTDTFLKTVLKATKQKENTNGN